MMFGKNKNGKGDFTIGMMVGGVLGALGAFLVFPKSGRRAHKEIQKQLEEMREQSHDLFEKTQGIEEKLTSCCKRKID